jgi:hypothetical protein
LISSPPILVLERAFHCSLESSAGSSTNEKSERMSIPPIWLEWKPPSFARAPTIEPGWTRWRRPTAIR